MSKGRREMCCHQNIYQFIYLSIFVIVTLNWSCAEKDKNPITVDDSKITWMNLEFPDVGNLSFSFCDEIVSNSQGDIFVSVWSGGIFRSQDHGQSWKQINANLANLFIDALAVNSKDQIFAGSQNVGNMPAGIFKSQDDGNTWNYVGLKEQGFSSLCINLNDSVFAGSSAGAIFRSSDNGENWTKVHPDIGYIVWTLIETSDGEILAGSGSGLFRSADQGDSWEQTGFPDSSVISIAVSNQNIVIAASGKGGNIFRSHDRGLNWTIISTILPSNQNWYWLLIINSQDRLFAASPDHGVYQSLDLGDSWQPCNDGLTDTEVSALGFDPEGYLYAATANAELFRTNTSTLTTPYP
jgi:photosystem II stability/assembly factor-like uncharacterized protein